MCLLNPAISQTLTPTKDAYVKGGINSDINYGTDDEIKVKHGPKADNRRISYVNFDLTDVSIVGNAIIRLYATSTKSCPVTVYQTEDNWSEETITWNTKPVLGTAISSTQIESADRYYEWDVTTYVQSKLGNNIRCIYIFIA